MPTLDLNFYSDHHNYNPYRTAAKKTFIDLTFLHLVVKGEALTTELKLPTCYDTQTDPNQIGWWE